MEKITIELTPAQSKALNHKIVDVPAVFQSITSDYAKKIMKNVVREQIDLLHGAGEKVPETDNLIIMRAFLKTAKRIEAEKEAADQNEGITPPKSQSSKKELMIKCFKCFFRAAFTAISFIWFIAACSIFAIIYWLNKLVLWPSLKWMGRQIYSFFNAIGWIYDLCVRFHKWVWRNE